MKIKFVLLCIILIAFSSLCVFADEIEEIEEIEIGISGVTRVNKEYSLQNTYSDLVLLAQMQTANTSIASNLRNNILTSPANLGAGIFTTYGDKFYSFVEPHNDVANSALSESLGYMALEGGILSNAKGDVIAEAGTKIFDYNADAGEADISEPEWHRVDLEHSFVNPVVIAEIASNKGGQAVHVRIRNVTSNSFEVFLEEWAKRNTNAHIHELVSFIVVEEGIHRLYNDMIFEAKTISIVDSADYFAGFNSVDFQAYFQSDPIVFSQTQTFNGTNQVWMRQKNVTSSGVSLYGQKYNGASTEIEEIAFLVVGKEDLISMPVTNLSVISGYKANFSWDSYSNDAKYILEKEISDGVFIVERDNILYNHISLPLPDDDTRYRVSAVVNGQKTLPSNIVTVSVEEGKVYVQHYNHSALNTRDKWLNNTFDVVWGGPILKDAKHGYDNWTMQEDEDAFLNNGPASETSQKLYGYFKPSLDMKGIGTRPDDGIRIYVDLDGDNKINFVTERIIDSWFLQGASLKKYEAHIFSSDKPYLFLVEYFNWSGYGSMTLEYKNSGGQWNRMPEDWFYLIQGMDMPSLSDEKEIISFEFDGIISTTDIDEADKTIDILVPNGADISNLTPVIEYVGLKIAPSAVVTDYSNGPVFYTVTATDNSTSVYTVNVTVDGGGTVEGSFVVVEDSDESGMSAISSKKYNFEMKFKSVYTLSNALYDTVLNVSLENAVLTSSGDIANNDGEKLFMKYLYPEVVDITFSNEYGKFEVLHLSQVKSNGIKGYDINCIVIDSEAHTKMAGEVTVTIIVKTDLIFNSDSEYILKHGSNNKYSWMELPFYIEKQLDDKDKELDTFNKNTDMKITSGGTFKRTSGGVKLRLESVSSQAVFKNRNLAPGE